MIQGITTPITHIDFLYTNALRHIENTVPEGEQKVDMIRSLNAANHTLRDIYQQYIGVLSLAAGMAVELREGCDDSRDSIENALVDAIALGAPLSYKRVFDRIEVGVGVQVDDDDIDEDQEG